MRLRTNSKRRPRSNPNSFCEKFNYFFFECKWKNVFREVIRFHSRTPNLLPMIPAGKWCDRGGQIDFYTKVEMRLVGIHGTSMVVRSAFMCRIYWFRITISKRFCWVVTGDGTFLFPFYISVHRFRLSIVCGQKFVWFIQKFRTYYQIT